jgi:uncharacterized protein (TIGR00730 family)
MTNQTHTGPEPEENQEEANETLDSAVQRSRDELAAAHAAASHLVTELKKVPEGRFIEEIVGTAMKLLRDQTNRGDIKLINQSLKELRYALQVFAPYREVRKVSIFGSARTPTTHPDYIAAADFARKMVSRDWMVITGAGGGIMEAGHGGAGRQPSFGLAIRLPFEQKTNEFIEGDAKLVNFKYFFTRKLMFVRGSHAIAVFPGGFGTMDEGFEVLTLVQTGKAAPTPIVFVDHKGGDFWEMWQTFVHKQLLGRKLISEEDLALYKITDDIDEAAEEVSRFYHNYHSSRYVQDELVMRLHRAPSAEFLAKLEAKYGEIARGEAGSRFRLSAALPAERDEVAVAHLPRLVMQFNRREHGKLRMLINDLNTL